jgi:hypothetical protein
MNIKALIRLNNRYSNRGFDINRVNLSRHNTKNTRNTLQTIVFFIGVFDRYYTKRR